MWIVTVDNYSWGNALNQYNVYIPENMALNMNNQVTGLTTFDLF